VGLLEKINSPDDLKQIEYHRLPDIASEIRDLIIDVVSKNGGHLASSLGTVELTIALHRVYNFGHDKLIWDVGHQSYAHKILTGNQYLQFIRNCFNDSPFTQKKIVLDCSNGATFESAPKIFKHLGMDTTVIFDQPDGFNINDHCGSQHTAALSKKVLELNADAGFAYDGDGDRLIAVNEKGDEITGDQLIAICSDYALKHNRLDNQTVVTTVMSNIGLKALFDDRDIKHIIADVGDRYVAEEMKKNNAVIGGEDSGHMIFMDKHTTGDGIYSSLKILEIMCDESKPLSELSGIMKVYPQKLINIEVDSKPDIYSIPEIKSCIDNIESRLKGLGRVLVRYSGTQLLCRVMVEGPTIDETEICCQEISDLIKSKIGIQTLSN